MSLPEVRDLEAWLATREAAAGGVRPGCAAHVLWHAGVARTPVSIVYVHGFSATGEELRPLPDLVAKALGANVFFARLTGHGQDGAAMGRARLSDWQRDVEEALEIGALIGDEVIVMGCSTGCTLVTSALAHGAQVRGVVHVSPNYGVANWGANALLQMPLVRVWGPYVAGRERSFEPISDRHAAMWTVRYDTRAVFTMADAVRDAVGAPIERITTPGYFAYCDADEVVSPAKTRAVMARWGGPVTQDVLVQGHGDDKMGHVMAGDVFSPAQTVPLAERIIAWARTI